jgi:sigma-B regulation protein RsbU (phosphoserine phosphatase)
MRILLVDDDRSYLVLLSKLLRARGHDVFCAEEGKEAREFLDLEQTDLIISDVYMPTLDGVWFQSYVREFSTAPDVPFIFISVRDDESTRSLVINPELDYFLSKGLPPEKLVSQIEAFAKKSTVGATRSRI